MATVDQLVVEIKAETAKLRRGLDRVNSGLNKTEMRSKAAGLALKKVGALAAAYFSARTVASILRVTATFEDLKDSLDTVFGSMSAGDKALDRILNFAQTTPFQVETLTQAFISLKSAGIEPTEDMLRVFGNTATITTDKVGTFNALIRLTQRSASGGLGLEELNMIADRGIDVLGILGDSFLKLGKNDIAKFGASAEGAKLIVDELIKGLDRKFPDTMGNYMDNLSVKVSNLQIAFKRLGETIAKESGLLDFTKFGVDIFAEGADNWRKIFQGQAEFFGLGGSKIKAKPTPDKVLPQLPEGVDPSQVMSFGTRAALNRGDALKKAKEEEAAQVKRQAEIVSFQAEFTRLAEAAADPLVEIREQIAQIEKISQNQQEMDLLGTTPEELASITEHLKELEKEALDTSDTISQVLAQSISNSAQAFTGEFVDAISSGKSALSSFGNFAEDIVKQIITTFLQMAVVNKILNSVFGSFMSTPLDTFSFGKAGGGAVQAGRPTLVGERGAEIFVPNSSGRIMNNADSMSAMGGGSGVTVNQSINFSTGVVPTVRAEVMRMMPQISDSTKAAVIEASQRGGRFRKALAGA